MSRRLPALPFRIAIFVPFLTGRLVRQRESTTSTVAQRPSLLLPPRSLDNAATRVVHSSFSRTSSPKISRTTSDPGPVHVALRSDPVVRQHNAANGVTRLQR